MAESVTTAARPRLPLTGGARPGRLQVIASAVTVLVVLAALAAHLVGRDAAAGSTTVPRVPTSAAVEARYGIRITRIDVSGGGGVIDLRFRVLDAERAVAAVHGTTQVPAIVDERTGGILKGLLMGMSPHHLIGGRGYYLLYRNDGGLLRPGAHVSVQIGSLWLRHVTVG